MQDIFNLLKRAGRRLGANRYLIGLHWMGIIVAGLALLMVIASKADPSVNATVDWRFVAPALAALALLGGYIWWLRRRPSLLHLAIAVDERLALNEKFSTALMCRERDDAFAQAAVDDAIAVAHAPDMKSRVSQSFGILVPRRWWITPTIVAAAIACGAVVPAGDWFADEAPELAADELIKKKEIEEKYEAAVREAAEKLNRSPEEIRELLAQKEAELSEKEQARSADDFQREAFKSLDSLKSELKQEADSDRNQALEQARNSLAKLNPNQNDGPAGDLSKALAEGDFAKAKNAVKELEEQLAQGALKPEDAAALQDLAKQIENLAQNQAALKESLAAAGIDPGAMNDSQALQQAIQNAQNLTAEQKQALAQQAAASNQASQAMQSMAQALGQMCEGGGEMAGGNQGGQNAAAGLGQQLSQMEMAQQELANLNAAMKGLAGACQGMGQGLGQGNPGNGISQQMAQAQWMQRMGQGGAMGQRGQGAGGRGDRFAAPMKLVDEKEKVSTHADAEIIGTTYIDGQKIVKGESKVAFNELVRAASSRASEDIDESVLPVEYESATKVFFGELQRRAEIIEESKTEPESPAPTPEPETSGN